MKKLATILSLALVIALSAGAAYAGADNPEELMGIVNLDASSVEIERLAAFDNPVDGITPVLEHEWEIKNTDLGRILPGTASAECIGKQLVSQT